MISQVQLLNLLADLESEQVERTEATEKTDKFAQAVCAFANDFPNSGLTGYLLIGIDKTGKPSGFRATEAFLEKLGGLRSDGNIQPLPAISISKISLPDGDVAVVEVRPSDMPPVRYKGRIWIRTRPRKAVASEQEERILTEKRIARAHSFDASPVTNATINDLSRPLFTGYRQEVVDEEVIAANHRSLEAQMASLRFFDAANRYPTTAGIIAFGKNPRFFLPGHYVQYLNLPGTELTELPNDQAEIDGDLLSMLRELDARIKANIHTIIEPVSALRERQVSDYPLVAVREVLLNAILHRDYQSNTPVRFYWFADRIEIQSPGGLYGEVTPETLTSRNSYRNPVIAEVMKALGYVNRYGYGIQRAQAALRANGNPPVRFDIDERVFLAVIPKRSADI